MSYCRGAHLSEATISSCLKVTSCFELAWKLKNDHTLANPSLREGSGPKHMENDFGNFGWHARSRLTRALSTSVPSMSIPKILFTSNFFAEVTMSKNNTLPSLPRPIVRTPALQPMSRHSRPSKYSRRNALNRGSLPPDYGETKLIQLIIHTPQQPQTWCTVSVIPRVIAILEHIFLAGLSLIN